MQIKVTRVEPKEQVSASGKKKYYVYTEDGDRHIAWGDWVENSMGKNLDVTVKEEHFKGNDYTVIWPAKESMAASPAVASDIAVRTRPQIFAERESIDLPAKTPDKLPQSYWERRDRLMARESALKSAAEVWSTKLSVGLDNVEKTNPLDLAKEFYNWITTNKD